LPDTWTDSTNKKCLICNLEIASIFDTVAGAPADIIFALTAAYKADTDPRKINLGVGAYRTEEGKPWVLPVVHKVAIALISYFSLRYGSLIVCLLWVFVVHLTMHKKKVLTNADSSTLGGSPFGR
jgi:aspartate aminotransferase